MTGLTDDRATADDDPLGRALLDSGVVDAPGLARAQERASTEGVPLTTALVDLELASETDIVVATAQRLGYRYVDLEEYPIDIQAVSILTEGMARRYHAIPLDWDEDQRLVVAMSTPSDLFTVDDLRIISGAELSVLVATPSGIDAAIAKWYRVDNEAEQLAQRATEEALEPVRQESADAAPIVRLANVLVAQAIADRASDVHLEPGPDDLRIRYRVDGVLHDVQRFPKTMQNALVSRLKIMAELNIAERRVPQDGRATGTFGGRTAELRVSVLPTVHGEQVTIRILDKSSELLSLDQLGFQPETMERYRRTYRRPYGTILVTGPTGSGKTTTLYATLSDLNQSDKKIITIEDPVEYQLPGIAQVQVNPKAGMTFAGALRSILRSDPDIVLVGEIRDAETATTAVEAALTGHLVLSTLHTNDAASTPVRLIEMGVEAYLVATALDAIVAQRLARRLCEKCRQPSPPTYADLQVLAELGGEPPVQVLRPVGCAACAGTGYYGRVAIHEVLIVTEEIERMIASRASSDDLRKLAVAQGMRTLRQAGLAQAASGGTSVEEILRVVL